MVVSNPAYTIENESILINNLFQLGLEYMHIRKPTSNIEHLSKLLQGIDSQYYSCISLHQHHQLASEFGIKRLHYTEHERIHSDSKKWKKQKDEGYTLSTSVHDMTSLPSLKLFEYIFYGPVFNSISKPNYHSELPTNSCLDKRGITSKIIALGGIDASNLAQIKEMNFDGAAVLGTIWNEPTNSIENFMNLKKSLSV